VARKKSPEEHENAERWLLTYADLITLLLAFFIVMYSMSKVDAKKFGAVQMALASVLHGGRSPWEGRTPGVPTDDKRQNLLNLDDLRHLQMKLGQSVRQKGDSTNIMTEINDRGLVIHVMENTFFESGQADLTPAAQQALDAIAEVIQGVDNFIRVEGHTDDRPINTLVFPSNWELSTARATSVVRYLIDNYDFSPDRVSASGYAEYRPIAPNDTPENRAKNRRVDIVILSGSRGADEPVVPEDAIPGLVKPRDRIHIQVPPIVPITTQGDSS
jgi:chemotaxis protein MotB